MKKLLIIITALILSCTSEKTKEKNSLVSLKKQSKQFKQTEKPILEVRKPEIIYDTIVFTPVMNNEMLLENFKTSQSQLKFYKSFIKSKNINRLNTITEKHKKTEIKYLGKLKDLNGLNEYDIITNFTIWGIGQMLSPRGRSDVAFVSNDKIIVYNLSMPYQLPNKIENNILYFTNEQTKIGISILGGLPPMLCIPEFGCY